MSKRSNEVEVERRLLVQPRFQYGTATPTVSLPKHDWGFFGEYEYLGVGTPYQKKMKAGVKPVNDLDKIAMYHDQQYSWTAQHTLPGTGIVTSGMRGISDYGAGAAMVNAALNPWSDLDFKDRALAFMAGDLLMVQGMLRLNPVTWGPMAFFDWLFY